MEIVRTPTFRHGNRSLAVLDADRIKFLGPSAKSTIQRGIISTGLIMVLSHFCLFSRRPLSITNAVGERDFRGNRFTLVLSSP